MRMFAAQARIRGETAIQLFDAKERLLSFTKSDLREHAILKSSPMPSYRETLSTGELADVVFSDPAALADLEEILHPPVRDEVRARLAELMAAGAEVACIEAIKLLESPLRDRCDETWVVRCNEADALARLATRGMSEADARARLANQTSQEAKLAAADRVIDGSAPIEETRRQVEAAHRALLAVR